MALIQKSYRIDSDMAGQIAKEAENRGFASDSALVRVLLANGLAEFSPLADKLVDLVRRVEQLVEQNYALTEENRQLASANLFMSARAVAVSEAGPVGESAQDSIKRQQARLIEVTQRALVGGSQLREAISYSAQRVEGA